MDLLPGEYGGGDSSNRIIAYLDADFARDVTDRKSRTECTTIVNGGPISWGKQTGVITSTTEVEQVAAVVTLREIII
jgi:hypothetical protein